MLNLCLHLSGSSYSIGTQRWRVEKCLFANGWRTLETAIKQGLLDIRGDKEGAFPVTCGWWILGMGSPLHEKFETTNLPLLLCYCENYSSSLWIGESNSLMVSIDGFRGRHVYYMLSWVLMLIFFYGINYYCKKILFFYFDKEILFSSSLERVTLPAIRGIDLKWNGWRELTCLWLYP